jgi:cyclase
MPTMLYKNFTLVKGVSFNSWRRVGSVMQAVRVYNLREVDELVLLDITATSENRKPDFQLIDDVADECFMPFTVGGGISNLEDVRKLLHIGADKVCINSAHLTDPGLIRTVADEFGSQCIVVSIDTREKPDGKYEVYSHSGTVPTGLDPVQAAISAEKNGAGEILITSIDHDGTMKGYDIQLIKSICDNVAIPVIASGGAGNYSHLVEAILEGGASSVAAASIFHFTEQTPMEAKKYLKEKGINVRI